MENKNKCCNDIKNTRKTLKNQGKRKSKKGSITRKQKSKSSRKSRSNGKTFVKSQCAPRKDKQLSFTCYSREGLDTLKKLWNVRHPDRSIKSKDPKEIWETLKEYMGECCNNERDWLRHNFMKQNLSTEMLNYTFAPKSPDSWKKQPNEWLSSIDIINVMKQYEHAYPEFEFIGPSPIDYDTHKIFGECVWEELCHFDLKKYVKKNVKHIGIIFNLDPHYKEGSHWVALFVSIKKGCVCFFDSYGEDPHPQIKKLMNIIQKQGKEIGLSLHQHVINNRHQYSNSEWECIVCILLSIC